MKAFEAGFRRLLDCFALAAVVIIGAMILIICVDVFYRNALNSGLLGALELTEYGLYFMTLFTAPWLLNRSQHIRIDFMLANVPYRVAWAMEALCDLIGIVVMAVLVWYGARSTIRSFESGTIVPKSFEFPEFWILMPLPICLAIVTVEFILRFVRLCRGERKPGATTAALG
jgi:TRAP-type C4-dicarboxylate transport system permease small subunit